VGAKVWLEDGSLCYEVDGEYGVNNLPFMIEIVEDESGKQFIHVLDSLEGFPVEFDLKVTKGYMDLYINISDNLES